METYITLHDPDTSSIDDFRLEVIKYFSSFTSPEEKCFFENPNDVFKKHLNAVGSSNLQDFIHNIPQKTVLENFIMTPINKETMIYPGCRYVVNANPLQQGSIVGDAITNIDNNGRSTQLVSLQLNKPSIIVWGFMVMFYRVYTTLYDTKYFHLHELTLEYEYFKRLLFEKCISVCSKKRKLSLDTNENVFGSNRGIEGANNSCYLDSLLFAMFYKTSMFHTVLVQKSTDTKYAKLTREILRNNVVYPLRDDLFCSARQIMQLRCHLQEINNDIMGSFMDVEELLYLLLQDALKEKEFINYDEGGEDFMHVLQIDNDDPSNVITTQKVFEDSMQINGDLKMTCVPTPAFILCLPRSNGKLVHYDAVVPNLELDIKNFLKHECCHYCKNFVMQEFSDESFTYTICRSCVENPTSNKLRVSRHTLRLRSVICIRSAHFVTFVRNGASNEWLFFDSMAGGCPNVKIVEDFEQWLTLVGQNPIGYNHAQIPLLIQRVFTDGRFCIYEHVKIKQ